MLINKEQFEIYHNLIKTGHTQYISARRALGFEPLVRSTTAEEDAVIEQLIDIAERNRPAPDHDPVNHPSHYTHYKGLEVIDLTEQMNFNLGNAVKYICRAGHKGGPEQHVEDLQKAAWYLDREIDRVRAEQREG